MRGRVLAAVVVTALGLSGCAGVPTSGPIQQGPVVAAVSEDQFIRVIARAPSDGMSPEEVVRGFQEATASPDAGYTIAREYLTAGASAAWDPAAGVRVTDTSGLALTRRGDVIAAEGGQSGTIDESGQYTVANPGSRIAVSYRLTQVGGQWRISSPPSGLVLGPSDIDRGYRTFDLFYFTRDFATLVPAPVTVPLSSSGLATQLVRGLIGGPTAWLAPAVRTAFPEGTRLTIDAVPVVDGVAEVALSTSLLSADETTRQKLSAQLVWTLRQLPEITGVQVTVNGQSLPVKGVGAVQPISSWPLVDPDTFPDSATGYAVDRRGLLQLGPSGVVLAGRLRPEMVSPAVSLDAARVAGVSLDRRSLWVGPLGPAATLTRRYTGTELSRPSWDSSGTVWVVDRGTGLVAVKGETVTHVPVTDLPAGVTDGGLLSVAVSRDGTRLAMLVRRGTRVEPLVARIERFGDNVRVAAPRRIEGIVTEAIDLAWLDADTLAVLGTSGASSLEVLQLPLGYGPMRRTGAPEGSVTLAAAPGRPIVVGADTGIYRNSGSTWTRVVDGTFPVYPG
jgi:hypothetical protein